MEEEQGGTDPPDCGVAEQPLAERGHEHQHRHHRADAQDVVGRRRVEPEVGQVADLEVEQEVVADRLPGEVRVLGREVVAEREVLGDRGRRSEVAPQTRGDAQLTVRIRIGGGHHPGHEQPDRNKRDDVPATDPASRAASVGAGRNPAIDGDRGERHGPSGGEVADEQRVLGPAVEQQRHEIRDPRRDEQPDQEGGGQPVEPRHRPEPARGEGIAEEYGDGEVDQGDHGAGRSAGSMAAWPAARRVAAPSTSSWSSVWSRAISAGER